MSAGIRPPLLLLGGQEAYAEYEKEFRIRYQNHFVNDVLGKRILFRAHMCRHVCFKSTDNNYNRVNYLTDVGADPENGFRREYFCVVAEWIDDKTASFITGFPVDRTYWQKCRRVSGRMYP